MARKRTTRKSSRGLIRRKGNGYTRRPIVRSRGFYRMIYSVSFRGT